MKYAAIFMIVLVLAGLALGVYTYANARLTVTAVSMNAAQGVEKAQDFAALQSAMDQNALMGTAYTESLSGSGLDYVFETYTFRLKNSGLIGAEMVEIEPIPLEGDALSYTTLDAAQVNANLIVPARQERDAWCVVLRSAGQDELLRYQRKFRVTYYIWGMAKTMTVGYR
ncbi:MAG: hypothetical protein IJ157_00300 [Clostridia bacterium]|nr:hypothetical protein [Clostridia bacterium]